MKLRLLFLSSGGLVDSPSRVIVFNIISYYIFSQIRKLYDLGIKDDKLGLKHSILTVLQLNVDIMFN